ncbi:MAG: LacI family DNA-binding transcriptional regulator [Lacrimispora sp.]
MRTNTNITISDVAKHAGVSKSTVSNYLNGKYEKMAAETKQAVEKTIKDLGYTPNLSARRLPNKEKSKTICLIIPRNLTRLFDSMYYPMVFHSIEKLAERMKYNILIYSRNRSDQTNEMLFLKGMASSMVDGFIIFDLQENDLFFKEFEEAKIPYVCVGKIDGYDDYRYVASDHKKAVEDVMEYLIQLGHRKIGIFRQSDIGVVEAVRGRAISAISEKHKLGSDDIQSIRIPVKSTDQEIYDIWKDVLTKPDRPTAYIISSAVRQPFLMVVQDLGLSVPEDLSYVNIEYYRRNNSSIENQTRVESRAGEIAEIAFKKLLRNIYNPTLEFRSQMISLDFFIGTTTAALK